MSTQPSQETIILFQETCGACHGLEGQGSPIAPPLNSQDLRSRLDEAGLTLFIRRVVQEPECPHGKPG